MVLVGACDHLAPGQSDPICEALTFPKRARQYLALMMVTVIALRSTKCFYKYYLSGFSQQPGELSSITIPPLQMGKLRLREIMGAYETKFEPKIFLESSWSSSLCTAPLSLSVDKALGKPVFKSSLRHLHDHGQVTSPLLASFSLSVKWG